MNKAESIRILTDISRRKQLMVIDEFANIWELTKDEPDFPRKLLKYYNITSDIKLTDRDILLLIGKYFDIKPKVNYTNDIYVKEVIGKDGGVVSRKLMHGNTVLDENFGMDK